MPYASGSGFERAHPLGHVPTVTNDLVQQRIRRYRRPEKPDTDGHRSRVHELLTAAAELPGEDGAVQWALAVDGSQFEQQIDERFPSTRTLFIQVAGVLVDLHGFRRRRHGFADLAAMADAQDAGVFAGFLPSSNLASLDESDPVRAFRQELLTLFAETTVNDRSLLDTLLHVEHCRRESVSGSAGGRRPRCPRPGCSEPLPDAIPREGATCGACGEPLYATDILRLHESFDPWGSNAEAAGRARTICEHLVVASFGRFVFERNRAVLSRLALICDGPLAIFGEGAKLRSGLLSYWQRMARAMRERGLPPPLLVGIEKSGEFVEHARDLGDLLPRGHLMRLPVDYISEFVSFRNSAYGKETYYGRKFVYRTLDERTMVITVPPLAAVGQLPYGGDDSESLQSYSTLRPICGLLDQIGTQLYEDAVIPVALAHGWTAYPMRTAGTVLKLHVAEQMARSEEGSP
jgi:hypothetical protein